MSNTTAKNYCNRVVYVKIIASQRWDVFLRHSVDIVMFTNRPNIDNDSKIISRWKYPMRLLLLLYFLTVSK